MTQMKDCEVMSGIISQLASYFVIPGFSSRADGETEGRGQGRDAGVEICQAALGETHSQAALGNDTGGRGVFSSDSPSDVGGIPDIFIPPALIDKCRSHGGAE